MQSQLQSLRETLCSVSTSKVSMKGGWAVALSLICIAMSVTHLLFNSYWDMVSIEKRSLHLAFVFVIVFLLYPLRSDAQQKKTAPSLLDIALAVFSAGMCLYMYWIYEEFAFEGLMPETLDIYLAFGTILLMFEACRRTTGWPLVILSAIFLLYAVYGNYAPGGFKIVPFSFQRVVYQMFYTDTGVFGTVLGVSATFIFMFVLFGAFLGETKSSEFFNDLSLALAGSKPGGPAKVALIASMAMGTISGSAVANVATTGTITIPLMKRVGYTPHFAGGVEAVASTGGSIMPPIMASAAFLMAEMLGIPYLLVIQAALIPALMYYLALWVMLDLEARKMKLSGLPKEQLPNAREVMRTRGHLLIPVGLIIVMLVSGRTPLFCAFWGVISAVVISSLRKETRLSLTGMVKALRDGAIQSMSPAVACATVGIIVGVSSMTGFGPMMVSNILEFAAGNLAIAMVLTMIASLILGMGLPTAACYITAATIAAPALIKLGVPPIAAHMFVLYYAVLSSLTPPVALASFTAAGIAESSLTKVSIVGLRLGSAGFIVPMMFIYSPALLMEFGDMGVFDIIVMLVTAVVGIIALGAAVENYFIVPLGIIERTAFAAVALLMIKPGMMTDLAGAALLAVLLLRISYLKRQSLALRPVEESNG